MRAVFATRPEPYVVLKDLMKDRRRDIQEELRSLRETLPAEIVDVKDAEEQSLDDLMRELNFALMEMKADALRQIDEAIRRLESGTYGVCVECAEAIPEARLRALPFVWLCRTCQEEEESREAAGRAARPRQPLVEELFAGVPARGESVCSRPQAAGSASGMRQSRTVGVRATATAAVGMCQGDTR